MDIIDGNIFEGMRMILPEHRLIMAEIEELNAPRKQPELTNDVWDEMQYLINEAIEHHQRVRIMLFGKRKNTVIEGIPAIICDRLVLNTGEGMRAVAMDQVMKIEKV